jgi:hypothetical protein
MSSRYALGDLTTLAPPPHVPIHAGFPTQWEEVESIVGTSLPSDYKRLINTYGTGDFCDQIWVLSPFSPKPHDLVSQINPMLEAYRDGLNELPEQCPFPAFPDPGGVLPFGGDMNGGSLFWVMEGSPDEWPIVIYDWRGGYLFEKYSMAFVEFLVGWLSGQLPKSIILPGMDAPTIKRGPVFCPEGSIRESLRISRSDRQDEWRAPN